MHYQIGTLVRLPENEPDAPVPKLLQGRYARVHAQAGPLYDLDVYTWYVATASITLHADWLEEVPPEEAARFSYIHDHKDELPDGERLMQTLEGARRVLGHCFLDVGADSLGVGIWLYDTVWDALRAEEKDYDKLSAEQQNKLTNAWYGLKEAADRIHEIARNRISS